MSIFAKNYSSWKLNICKPRAQFIFHNNWDTLSLMPGQMPFLSHWVNAPFSFCFCPRRETLALPGIELGHSVHMTQDKVEKKKSFQQILHKIM